MRPTTDQLDISTAYESPSPTTNRPGKKRDLVKKRQIKSKFAVPLTKNSCVKCSIIGTPGWTLPLVSVLRWKPYLHCGVVSHAWACRGAIAHGAEWDWNLGWGQGRG